MEKLFAPKTIAVVGASQNQEKVGGILIKKLLNYKGKVFPINPSAQTIQGLKAYSSLESCKEKVDLVIIAVPAEFVYSTLEQCAKCSVNYAIVITAGFSEVGKNIDEEKLVQFARKNNIRLLGPNCFGICNPSINLDTTFSALTPKEGDVAFISQSGALWSFISD